MRVLLPPSESKVAGGAAGSVFDSAALSFPELAASRARVLDAVVAAAERAAPAPSVARQRWIDDNRALRSAPTLPAIERYAGVLYDAVGVSTLENPARAWLDAHVVIASALFGFVRAGDGIPSYKFSNSGLTGPLRGAWREVGSLVADGFVVDLRSKAYAQLAPVSGAVDVEVIGVDGAALNHWNKHGKGALVRSLAEAQVVVSSVEALVAWAADAGIPLTRSGDRLRLVAAP